MPRTSFKNGIATCLDWEWASLLRRCCVVHCLENARRGVNATNHRGLDGLLRSTTKVISAQTQIPSSESHRIKLQKKSKNTGTLSMRVPILRTSVCQPEATIHTCCPEGSAALSGANTAEILTAPGPSCARNPEPQRCVSACTTDKGSSALGWLRSAS